MYAQNLQDLLNDHVFCECALYYTTLELQESFNTALSIRTYQRAKKQIMNNYYNRNSSPVSEFEYAPELPKSKEVSGVVSANAEITVFIPDVHIPYEDKAAVNAALSLVEYLKPKTVFLLGDVHDNPSLSSHNKTPWERLQLQEDLNQIDTFLTRVRKVSGNAEIFYIEGNHEARTQTFLSTKAPEFYGLDALKPENLYQLKKHNITWMPTSETHVHHGIVVTHGTAVAAGSGESAKKELNKYGVSGISGHVHRMGMHRTHKMFEDHCWWEAGCLCSLDPSYVVGTPNWHQGLAVGSFTPNQKRFLIELVPVFDGTILYGGKLFK